MKQNSAGTLFNYRDFTHMQLAEWPMAARNYNALNTVDIRKIRTGNTFCFVQYNAERYRSTTANIQPEKIQQRPCFLCASNRPVQQISHLLKNGYELLVNPYPIFKYHFTIPSLSHIPQKISDSLTDLLEISRLLQPLVVFYNGAFCGASAPDHKHFQAFEKNEWVANFENNEIGTISIFKDQSLEIYQHGKKLCNALVFKSNRLERINEAFQKLLPMQFTPDGHE